VRGERESEGRPICAKTKMWNTLLRKEDS
jgi:hypothetical protein